MNNIKIGVVGYKGRMGQEICNILQQKSNIEIITNGGEQNEDKTKIFKKSDVVIDFTNTEGLRECLTYVEKYNTPFVSGSTAITNELMQKMLELSQKTKICWSANMSVGVALTKKISAFVGEKLKEYDCEILEKHHNKKKDAPSGTAIMIGKAIAESRQINFDEQKVYDRNCERQQGQIGFASIRGGSIFGEHDVMFIGNNDEITITHKAYNRRLFAVGAVECALNILKQNKNGFYTIEDLLL